MIFWIASYPKNGNTWLRTLLSAYYFTKDGNFINDKITKVSPVSPDKEKILCNHCKRTASNGIRCLGICVADNDY